MCARTAWVGSVLCALRRNTAGFLAMPNCFELFSFSFVFGPPSLRLGVCGGRPGSASMSTAGGSSGAGTTAFSKAWLLKAQSALESDEHFLGQTVGCACSLTCPVDRGGERCLGAVLMSCGVRRTCCGVRRVTPLLTPLSLPLSFISSLNLMVSERESYYASS